MQVKLKKVNNNNLFMREKNGGQTTLREVVPRSMNRRNCAERVSNAAIQNNSVYLGEGRGRVHPQVKNLPLSCQALS